MKRLFGEALERPEHERESYVADASQDDPQLGREVRDMLRAYAVQDGFIEQSAAEHLGWAGDSAAPDWIGRRIGPYRVVAEAGRGGLGRVFRAVRDDGEVEQQVAIKLLHAGLGTEALLARFRAERRILARLNHPHIAHFLDGAATEDGLPYLVMEFVEGEPIDDYCDAHALGLEARLQLFRDLCSAVHHVHQNLLVHGDIKGGNVLVTREGSVKLLDFGIAKLLDPAGNVTGRPATLLLMTPEYASPEQRRGESITTASDVYSLGALLYMLLTGTTPAASSTAGSPSSVAATERLAEPIAPSIAATLAGGAHAGFARALGGDLDTIILKALKQDPNERYGSAEQLGDDLQRYLRGFPIEARPDSAWYRISKFARRNSAAAIATGLFVVALVGGGAAALWQAHEARVERERAERHFQTVRKLSAAFLGDVYDSIAKIPGSTGARKLLVDNALVYLEALERDAPDSAELRRDLGIAWERLGDVQGAYLTPSLGEIAQSLDSYRRSLAIREALVKDHPTSQHRTDLLSIQVTFGEALLGADGAEEARHILGDATVNADALVAAIPVGPQWRKAAAAYMVQGWSEWSGGRVESGMASLQRARELYEAIAAATPGDRTARRDVALVLGRIGQAHMDATARHDEALGYYQRAYELLVGLARDVPDDAEIQRMRVYTRVMIAQLHVLLRQPREALRELEPEIATLDRWRIADPNDVVAPIALGAAQNLLGESRLQLGDFAAARAEFAAASELLPPSLAEASADVRVIYGQLLAGQAQAAAGMAQTRSGPARAALLNEARVLAQRAIAILEPIATDGDNGRQASLLLQAARTVLAPPSAAGG